LQNKVKNCYDSFCKLKNLGVPVKTNEELLKILDANPNLRKRVEALAEISQGSLNNEEITWGDTAEGLIARELDGMGHDILEKWANSRSK
jgi:hypothetical protein